MSTPEIGTTAGAEGTDDRLLVFTLEGREFAVPVESVVEVVRHGRATPVPRFAPMVEGVAPIRGRMVTIVDLRTCLGLPRRAAGAASRVIVVEAAADRVGLVVDRVCGVSSRESPASRLDVGGLLQGIR